MSNKDPGYEQLAAAISPLVVEGQTLDKLYEFVHAMVQQAFNDGYRQGQIAERHKDDENVV